ncbi:MAG: amidohydrolase family protein [Elusimicrobia bacterium]|nr:amidohydrolase family protein [Elusimicrobiota bacterium]
MLLMWDAVAKGRLSPQRFVDITATTPAKMFGLYPQKGSIVPGADADILLLDPNKKYTISAKTHHMNVDYSPYEGKIVDGSVQDVFVRGEQMVKAGKFVGKHSHGKFQRRAPRVN